MRPPALTICQSVIATGCFAPQTRSGILKKFRPPPARHGPAVENRSDFRYAKKRRHPPSKIVPISATCSGILKKFRPPPARHGPTLENKALVVEQFSCRTQNRVLRLRFLSETLTSNPQAFMLPFHAQPHFASFFVPSPMCKPDSTSRRKSFRFPLRGSCRKFTLR